MPKCSQTLFVLLLLTNLYACQTGGGLPNQMPDGVAPQTNPPTDLNKPIGRPETNHEEHLANQAAAKSSLQVKLNTTGLNQFYLDYLKDRDIELNIISEQLNGPRQTPIAIDDIDNIPKESFPSSIPSPSPVFQQKVFIKVGQDILIKDLPQNLKLIVTIDQNLPNTEESKSGPCENSSYTNLSANDVVQLTQSTQHLELKLTALTISDISACETTMIHGKVFDESQNPVESADILIQSLNTSVPFQLTGKTDANGYFQVIGVTPGIQIELQVSKADYQTRKEVFVASANKTGDPKVNYFEFGGLNQKDKALKKIATE